jgi:two-component system sensor histidine kinase SenX3
MDVVLLAVSGAVGLVVGLAAGLAHHRAHHLAYRLARRRARPEPARPPAPDDPLPPGVGQVLSVLPSLAVVLDDTDTVVKASSAAYAFGIVRADRIAADELLDLARKVRRDGLIRQVELDLPRGPVGGGRLAVSARVAPLGAQVGAQHVLVLVEDQTDVKRIDAIRRDFVANVGHELKTPVGALGLLSEAVLGASDDPQAVRRFAQRMQHESLRLSHLVQELIDLSRLESQDPLKQPHPVSVDDVIEAGIDRSRELATARRITLEAGGERGLKVYGSEAQLTMALANLVENAVNYSPDDTRVAVAARQAADLVEITVTDQGIGIPERDLQRIFERFYRVDPARSRMTGGTGLGLSIVKHVARNHGGEVRVWSVEGSGSTFTLRLPLLTTASPSEPDQAPSEERIP